MDFNRAHHHASFRSLILLCALSFLIPLSASQRTWSRLPEVAVPSFTRARGPKDTGSPNIDEPPQSGTTMPAQFGGFPPFSNPTTSSQTSAQTSGFVAETSNSGSADPTDSGPGLTPITTNNGPSPTGLPSDTALPGQSTFQSVDTSFAISRTGFATTFTTTVTDSPLGTGLGRASSAISGTTGASTSEPAPVPEPVLREQSVVGISVGIGVWLLIIIGVLSCLLWRKRKRRGVVKDPADEPPPEMANAFTEYGDIAAAPMVRAVPHRVPERAPSLPPPFFSRTASTDDHMPPPLRSHPVSRGVDSPPSPVSPIAPYREAPRGRSISTRASRTVSGSPGPSRVASNSPGPSQILASSPVPSRALASSPEPFRGLASSPEPFDGPASSTEPPRARSSSPGFPILSSSPRESVNTMPSTSGTVTRSASSKSSAIVKVRSISKGGESPQSPDRISELPPSLGKLNSWLEENRRRSRMTESGILGLEGVPPVV